jgi:hypothetical protein
MTIIVSTIAVRSAVEVIPPPVIATDISASLDDETDPLRLRIVADDVNHLAFVGVVERAARPTRRADIVAGKTARFARIRTVSRTVGSGSVRAPTTTAMRFEYIKRGSSTVDRAVERLSRITLVRSERVRRTPKAPRGREECSGSIRISDLKIKDASTYNDPQENETEHDDDAAHDAPRCSTGYKSIDSIHDAPYTAPKTSLQLRAIRYANRAGTRRASTQPSAPDQDWTLTVCSVHPRDHKKPGP